MLFSGHHLEQEKWKDAAARDREVGSTVSMESITSPDVKENGLEMNKPNVCGGLTGRTWSFGGLVEGTISEVTSAASLVVGVGGVHV